MSGESVVERDLNWLQPDLRLVVVQAHVTEGWLVAIKAHEEKTGADLSGEQSALRRSQD